VSLKPVTPEMLRFDSCGRLVPPSGFVFLDLFRVIPLRLVQAAASEGGTPAAPVVRRVANQAATIFYAQGLAGVNSGLEFSLRWPSGRAIQTRRVWPDAGLMFPLGSNNHQWCFESPVPIGPGDSVTVECASNLGGGNVELQLWGYVRWMLALDEASQMNVNQSCLVGYPLKPVMSDEASAMLPGVAEAQASPRYSCDPVGQNLAAVAVQLGNQPSQGEPRVFETAAVVLGYNEGVFDQRLIVPFDGLVVITAMRVRAVWSQNWPVGVTSDIQYAVRMPDGYQVTGPDLVSNAALGFTPVFPSVPVRGGERISFDVVNQTTGVSGVDASVTAVVEFHGYRAAVNQ
jgi:hypothetical protein